MLDSNLFFREKNRKKLSLAEPAEDAEKIIRYKKSYSLLRYLQISQFVILNGVKDLFLVLQKQILHSVQDDRIRENRLLQEALFLMPFSVFSVCSSDGHERARDRQLSVLS